MFGEQILGFEKKAVVDKVDANPNTSQILKASYNISDSKTIIRLKNYEDDIEVML